MGGLQKEFFHMIVEAVFDPGKYPNLLLGFMCCTSSYKIIYAADGIRTRQFFLATELPRIESDKAPGDSSRSPPAAKFIPGVLQW